MRIMDIPGHEGRYAASEYGEIWSHISKKWLKQCTTPNGYRVVGLWKPGAKNAKATFVHRLVAEAFLPFDPVRNRVNHINGIKADNRLVNLERCTSSENNQHAYDAGLKAPAHRKLTQEQARRVRYGGERLKDLSAELGMSMSALCQVRSGATWRNL
jgi:hypothetical protein